MLNSLGMNGFVWGTNTKQFKQNGSQQELNALKWGTNGLGQEQNALGQDEN